MTPANNPDPTAAATPAADEAMTFFPVATESIDARVLEMDLYLLSSTNNRHVLYRSIGVEFTAEDRRRLIEQRVPFVYVPTVQHAAYRKLLCAQLDETFHDPARSRAARARLVRSTCERMIKDVLLFPGQHIQLATVEDVSRQFARWAAESEIEFSYLLDMSAHDFYTVTHSVNVGVAAALLAQAVRPADPELHRAVIQGGLLHDIGKRHVPDKVLNKPGALKNDEWQLIRKHPDAGHEELARHPHTSPLVLEMIRDHHEKLDGTGYPRGLSGDQVGFAARLCAVVDVYDAITTARPYRGPTPPRKTLAIMAASAAQHFDPALLGAWHQLVERLLDENAARAVPEACDPGVVPTGDYAQQPPIPAPGQIERQALRLDREERRRHERITCNRVVRVRFIRQCKRYPVPLGEWLNWHCLDISRGGLQLRTPWPLTLNDVLEIELGHWGGGDNPLACVVRVRADEPLWRAGLQFIARSSPGAAN